MASIFDKFPFTGYEGLNLDWVLQNLKQLFGEGEALYQDLREWKEDTTTEVQTWISNTNNALAAWKTQTESDFTIQITSELNSAKQELLATVSAGLLAIEGVAYGTQNGEPVEEGSPYWHNNCAWYKQQASDSAIESRAWANGANSSPLYVNNNSKYFRERSEAWAVGQINGTDVPDTDDTHENNAKYYANQIGEAAAQIETNTGDIADLKIAVDDIGSYFVPGINLFNPNDPDLLENYKLNNDGTTTAETGKIVSGYIPVIPGKTVCVNYPTGIYGSASTLVWYDSNKQRIDYSNPSRYTDARGIGYLKYTMPENPAASYFRATGIMAGLTTYMYVYADEMPSTYIPYTDKVTLNDDVVVPFESINGVSVSKDDTVFIKPELVNLVDFSAMTPGIVKNSSTDGGINENSSWLTTDFIPVEPGATYALCIFPGVYYGSNFVGIPVYDDSKTQIARVTQAGGSIGEITGKVTITIPDRADAKYIRTSYYKSYIDTSANLSAAKLWYKCQIFKANAWPLPADMYIPYDGTDKLIATGLENAESVKYNALFGKSALWNGDSICAADGDTLGGWAGRIGISNGMSFKNYGYSGGTIAENTGTGHSVSATIDNMITNYPNADYIIIEGGTNDADILGNSGIGTFDADDFSSEYIAALDKDTFSGALESIFYRLVTQMKGKHIGYLIPQKMGHTEELVARRRVYFDRAVAIAQKWGIPVLDLWNDFYLNWRLSAHWDQTMTTAENEAAGNLYIDGQHLTTTGYAVEAPVIAEWMKTI